MGWKATGTPTVRQQRGRWVVRVDGLDTETGLHRPRQLGTYASQRTARAAATKAATVGDEGGDRGTVGWLVDRWVRSRTDVGAKTREQYEWAAGHIRSGLGSVRMDRLDRDDIATWLEALAAGGRLSHRSIQIVRMVTRAAFADAVEEGLVRRSPAGRVPMPREVAKQPKEKEVDAWNDSQVAAFLAASAAHRWAGPMRLEVLYGLRRSELLALHWADVDLVQGRVRIDKGLVEVRGRSVWTDGKNDRSRRTLAIDAATTAALAKHRAGQDEERLVAGPKWHDHDMVVATRTGLAVGPRNYSSTLERIVARAGVPRLTSHGLRHTSATHMVRDATDAGELRAIADVLGHSPDMLMNTYAHALPDSVQAVADRVGERSSRTPPPRT